MFRVRVQVMPKRGILDPQGQAVESALHSLQFDAVEEVRIGKHMEILIRSDDPAWVEQSVREMCQRLLANPVIEDFSYHIEEV
ncbi:MAG: phosphoribosylformylglycinamidine synthase subunit PurS [Syntrophomonadaceae bacterium]|nr:phosphoribosylformylglycinamidine synthase subunit PurS [Syntrophomonadaceae bacterium]